MGAELPKQYLKLDDQTILEHTLHALLSCAQVGQLIVALAADDQIFESLPVSLNPRVKTVLGGEERSDSVRAGLSLTSTPYVMIHDAARPFIQPAEVEMLIERCLSSQACGGLLCAKSTDTLKLMREDEQAVSKTLPREQIYRALTPQLFKTELLKRALDYVREHQLAVTDDAQALELSGYSPLLVPSDPHNFKITTRSDLQLARALVRYQASDAADSLK